VFFAYKHVQLSLIFEEEARPYNFSVNKLLYFLNIMFP
jgi:hypothetical protein